MQHNYKFHAMAIGGICVAITILYLFIGPKAPPPVVEGPQGDRYIQIDYATWGEECNPYIQQTISAQAATPVTKDADGKIVQQEVPTLVQPNNVLGVVSSICNGKLTCQLNPTSKTLQLEPLASCYKKLQVRYRCFAYDRLWDLTIEQGKTAKIDCEKNAQSPAPGQTGSPNAQ